MNEEKQTNEFVLEILHNGKQIKLDEENAKKYAVLGLEASLKTEEQEALEQFDEYKTFDDIPKEAIEIMEENKISLLDALLRYRHKQDKKIKDELKTQEKNKEGTLGSLKTNGSEYQSDYITALLNGIKK